MSHWHFQKADQMFQESVLFFFPSLSFLVFLSCHWWWSSKYSPSLKSDNLLPYQWLRSQFWLEYECLLFPDPFHFFAFFTFDKRNGTESYSISLIYRETRYTLLWEKEVYDLNSQSNIQEEWDVSGLTRNRKAIWYLHVSLFPFSFTWPHIYHLVLLHVQGMRLFHFPLPSSRLMLCLQNEKEMRVEEECLSVSTEHFGCEDVIFKQTEK